MKNVMLIFGTRPEAIKMAPVYHALLEAKGLQPIVCVTAQHRGLLDQVLKLFDIKPDYDLDIMKANQTLPDITSNVLRGTNEILVDAKPDLVLVHGDTSTTLAGCLAAFYARIPVGHVEAGLRTGDMGAPFPEEMNRKVVGAISTLHFAPTTASVFNLAHEGIQGNHVILTGNTSIDALMAAAAMEHCVNDTIRNLANMRTMILMTAHRRENFGTPFEMIFEAVSDFARSNPKTRIVYPLHPNPNVKGPAEYFLGSIPNVSLIPPVDYLEMVYLMKHCQFILTDSGGIQEEAPALGKPVLVFRNTTERPEAIAAGCAMLVGSDKQKIITMMTDLLDTKGFRYRTMSESKNPFGDGTAAKKIVAAIQDFFGLPRILKNQKSQEWADSITHAY